MATKNKVNSLVGNIIGNETEPASKSEVQTLQSTTEKSPTPKVVSTSEKGVKPGETRASFICNKKQLKKMKFISLVTSSNIKDEVAAAFDAHINKWEKNHGEIDLERFGRP